MRTLRLLMISATAACLGFAACSDDDSEQKDTVKVPNAEYAGTYNLTGVEVPELVDFNVDGTSNTNLMLESSCYVNSNIVMNEDGTYTASYNSVLFEAESGCYAQESAGDWDIMGDQVMLTDLTTDPVTAPVHYDLDNRTLTLTMENALYPTRDDFGEPTYHNGTVKLTYTKASPNN